ncbi:LOW QUALITY PROTEIN: O(6)-methylguanine-induced apoptosis 2 [Heteronotia binoei]|uniref:LOW QUALITY PROTEIN: O(6)-methylguanine-induced apoptosis 2 n=1 Tax=Heteronotia binoei TaxID=13085 RepID=UPI00292EAD58|nr:LOW QUALITY PROTEIN: O(6)-methylguanine-induced apoptosis 2 [Heteronotia binoei]
MLRKQPKCSPAFFLFPLKDAAAFLLPGSKIKFTHHRRKTKIPKEAFERVPQVKTFSNPELGFALPKQALRFDREAATHLAQKDSNFSSVPLKFQTSVISNTERKGFNSQSKRFLFIPNDNPGPGCYNVTHPSTVRNNVSQSRKGTCSFPSLDVRVARHRVPSYPAANAYSLPTTLQSKHDFSLGYSSMFQQPIARKIRKAATPAPNQYNVSLDACKGSQNIGAKSVFSSKTRRELPVSSKDRVPSPCHYQIKDSFVRQSPAVLVSWFKSRTTRETKTEFLSPGPAAYQQRGAPSHLPSKFWALRKHTLNFSASPAPRPKPPPSPGPGQYEIVDFEGPSKHYISSAVFVSNTDRCFRDKYHQEIPGPGAYDLPIPQKQSFIYNTKNKWVPVL